MTIEYHCSSDDGDMFPATPAEAHARHALEQSSFYAATLVIARCTGNADTATPARAAWLARAHGNLQQWLAAGGFAQADAAPAGRRDRLEDTLGDSLPFPGSRPLYYDQYRSDPSIARGD